MPLSKYKFNAGEQLPAVSIDSINPDLPATWSAGLLSGGANPSAIGVFQALGNGANNAKIKANINGVIYDNIAIDLKPIDSVASSKILQSATGLEYQVDTVGKTAGQTFTVPAGVVQLTKFRISTRVNGTGGANPPTFECRLVNASGTVVQTGMTFTSPSGNWREFTLTTPLAVSAGDVIYIGIVGNTNDGNNYHAVQYYTSAIVGSLWINGSPNGSYDATFEVYGKAYTVVADMNAVATQVQAGIRTATSGLETCVYSTNKFVITSAIIGRLSQILKLMTPSSGTDISGLGTAYLDCASNATETLGTGDDYILVRTNRDGSIANPLKLNSQSGTAYTLVITDSFKYVVITNASAITLTIPTNAVVAFPIGTEIYLIQGGAGKLTVGGAGITINSLLSYKSIAGAGGQATLVKVATDIWQLYGNLIA